MSKWIDIGDRCINADMLAKIEKIYPLNSMTSCGFRINFYTPDDEIYDFQYFQSKTALEKRYEELKKFLLSD